MSDFETVPLNPEPEEPEKPEKKKDEVEDWASEPAAEEPAFMGDEGATMIAPVVEEDTPVQPIDEVFEQKVSLEDQVEKPAESFSAVETPVEEKSGSNKTIWIIVLVVIVLFIICCCLIIFAPTFILPFLGPSIENVFDNIINELNTTGSLLLL